jgi:hypothetical protein
MADKFASHSDTPISAARKLVAVTPSNSTDLTDLPKALWIGVAGDISVIAADDTDAVTVAALAGVLPIRVKRVRSTGTTATGIVALY